MKVPLTVRLASAAIRRIRHAPENVTALQPSHRLLLRGLLASSFPAFAALYLLLFAAFGAISPFLPAFLGSRGLRPPQIGTVISCGTFAQIVVGPLAGMVADVFGARRVLATAAATTACMAVLYLAASGYAALLAVGVCYFATIAALNPLADALALNAAVHEQSFRYGWIRGLGSASFIAGLLISGQIVARHGLDVTMVAGATFFALALGPIAVLPALPSAPLAQARGGVLRLLSIAAFRRMLLLAALVIGSHAMNDTFGVIEWRGLGVEPATVGVLSALAVGSEIVVFALVGPSLVNRLGASRCIALTATAGALRWAIMAEATSVPFWAVSQSLHGLTFALTHLACMRVIATQVPERLSATAQAVYGTLSVGAATATIILVSGHLYGVFGAHAFWSTSALCVAAIPLSRRNLEQGAAVRRPDESVPDAQR